MRYQHYKWHSHARKAAHPLSLRGRLLGYLAMLVNPLRRLLGRLVLMPQQSHIDVGAAFKAWQGEGDYAEFGVYAGKSFVHAYHAIKRAERRRGRTWKTRFFAFDSFEGLPDLQGRDTVYKQYQAGAYAATQDEFMHNITRHGVDPKDVVVVPGFYRQTRASGFAEQHQLSKLSMVYIDCDLYESTRDALACIAPYVIDGCVLIFADWYLFQANPQLGQQRAFAEWLDEHERLSASPYVSIAGEFHASFILHRALDEAW